MRVVRVARKGHHIVLIPLNGVSVRAPVNTKNIDARLEHAGRRCGWAVEIIWTDVVGSGPENP